MNKWESHKSQLAWTYEVKKMVTIRQKLVQTKITERRCNLESESVTSQTDMHARRNWALFWHFKAWQLFNKYTHAPNNMPVPTIAYFINTLASQSSGRGRGGPNYFKVGDLFYKICTSLYANFQEKKSHPIRRVEGLKLCFDFLRNVCFT